MLKPTNVFVKPPPTHARVLAKSEQRLAQIRCQYGYGGAGKPKLSIQARLRRRGVGGHESEQGLIKIWSVGSSFPGGGNREGSFDYEATGL